MPHRDDIPTDLTEENVTYLYDDLGWSIRDITEHLFDVENPGSRNPKYRAVREVLRDAGYGKFDSGEKNRGPVTGPARKLWEMEPDELGGDA